MLASSSAGAGSTLRGSRHGCGVQCSWSFEQQLVQLTASFRPLPVMVHIPGLVTSCHPVQGSGSCLETPLLTLCVDTSEAHEDLGIVHASAASSDEHANLPVKYIGASVWLRAAEANEDDEEETDLFSLQQRESTISCSLRARARPTQVTCIELPNSSMLVWTSSSGDMSFKNVTVQGVRNLFHSVLSRIYCCCNFQDSCSVLTFKGDAIWMISACILLLYEPLARDAFVCTSSDAVFRM